MRVPTGAGVQATDREGFRVGEQTVPSFRSHSTGLPTGHLVTLTPES